MIKENLLEIFKEIEKGNNLGEKITLVGATKFVSVEDINEAISLGLKDIAENKAQEFRDKFDSVLPVNYHFIGRLQKNKVKYLIGKAYLIQSVDSLELLDEIDRQSGEKNVSSSCLIEVNLGEENKGGFPFSSVAEILEKSKDYKNVTVKGLMAMLPDSDDESLLINLLNKLRSTYDNFKKEYGFEYLSCGMSGDYKLCIKHGSNMIRVGSKIFGKRY